MKTNKKDRKGGQNEEESAKILISFEGAGMVWWFFLGVYTYLLEEFELSNTNVQFQGVSAGTGMAFMGKFCCCCCCFKGHVYHVFFCTHVYMLR